MPLPQCCFFLWGVGSNLSLSNPVVFCGGTEFLDAFDGMFNTLYDEFTLASSWEVFPEVPEVLEVVIVIVVVCIFLFC